MRTKYTKILCFGYAFFFFMSCVCYAQGMKKITKLDIEPDFVNLLPQTDRILTSTGVKKIKLQDERTFIFCIVYTPFKGDNALAYQKMLKVCQMKALAEVLNSRGCTVYSQKSLKTGMTEISDGENVEYKSVSELLQVTKTEARGVVQQWPLIGTWLSADKSIFYYAAGMLFDKSMKAIEVTEKAEEDE